MSVACVCGTTRRIPVVRFSENVRTVGDKTRIEGITMEFWWSRFNIFEVKSTNTRDCRIRKFREPRYLIGALFIKEELRGRCRRCARNFPRGRDGGERWQLNLDVCRLARQGRLSRVKRSPASDGDFPEWRGTNLPWFSPREWKKNRGRLYVYCAADACDRFERCQASKQAAPSRVCSLWFLFLITVLRK